MSDYLDFSTLRKFNEPESDSVCLTTHPGDYYRFKVKDDVAILAVGEDHQSPMRISFNKYELQHLKHWVDHCLYKLEEAKKVLKNPNLLPIYYI